MSPQAKHIFNPMAHLDPSLLVHLLESWAKADPDPSSILCDLRVTSIMHNKMPQPPEHEFLVVETEDRAKVTRFFILERTVDPGLINMPAEGPSRPTAMESVKQLCAAMTTSSSDLASVEEGLQQFDRLTVSTVQAVNITSDSLDNKGSCQALDRFLGCTFVYCKGWQGENVRFLKPAKHLSFYQLVIIAQAVHAQFSTYKVFKDQCYFHAGTIYSAVLHLFGSLTLNEPSDITLASNLKYGRWHGVKVKAINQKDVEQIVDDYKKEYEKVMKAFEASD